MLLCTTGEHRSRPSSWQIRLILQFFGRSFRRKTTNTVLLLAAATQNHAKRQMTKAVKDSMGQITHGKGISHDFEAILSCTVIRSIDLPSRETYSSPCNLPGETTRSEAENLLKTLCNTQVPKKRGPSVSRVNNVSTGPLNEQYWGTHDVKPSLPYVDMSQLAVRKVCTSSSPGYMQQRCQSWRSKYMYHRAKGSTRQVLT